MRPVDWPMFGLKASMAHLAPSSGAAQPLRESGEMFPRWAARPRRRLTLGLTCSLHRGAARKLLAAFRAAHPDVDLVALGLGVSVCSGATLGAFYPGVCTCPIDSAGAEIAYSLMWRADARNDALADFIGLAATLTDKETDHGLG